VSDERCSFCKKGAQAVRRLISGPAVYICDECVDVCVEIIRDNSSAQRAPATEAVHWGTGASAVYCALCRMPFLPEDALLVESKGVLCRPCVSQVQALSTGAGLVDEDKH
jgi:hypothetical protein